MIKLLIAADILLASAFAWRFTSLPEQIPLLYSRPWGEPQIVEYWYIFLLPVIMHLFYFLNGFLIKKYFSHDDFFKKLFIVTNISIIVTFSSIFLKILFLVT